MASTNSEPISKESSVGVADHVGLADAGLEHLEDAVIDAVNHCTGLGEQDDLVVALDLPGSHHCLLAVNDSQPCPLEGKEDAGFGQIDTEPLTGYTCLFEGGLDLPDCSIVKPGLRSDRSLQPGVAAIEFLVSYMWGSWSRWALAAEPKSQTLVCPRG